MRLKDKLADRANASSEVEYDNAYGILISEEGKGVKSIIEMVNSTRMDCAIGSAAGAKRFCLFISLSLHRLKTSINITFMMILSPVIAFIVTEHYNTP